MVLFSAQGFAEEISQNLIGGGGLNTTSSTSYSASTSVGDSAIGKMTGGGYIMIGGFQAGLMTTTYSTGSVIASSVQINSPLFDGKAVFDNDNVSGTAVLTATITSSASTISPEVCTITIDGTATTFSNIPAASGSYTQSSGVLSYTLALNDGTHTIAIKAYDQNSNSETYSRTVVVNTGAPEASQVFLFPNPLNPTNTTGKIGYQLSQDADVSIYIFNAIGQLIYKRDYVSGSSGGQVGYNEVDFLGVSDFGQTLANDVYFLRIVSGGKPIGRAKIAILK